MSDSRGTDPTGPDRAPAIAIIGGGPRGSGVLERLAANLDEMWGRDRPLVVHVIDPFPPGAGRIWRHDQSPLLKLNSLAEDVTMFTDETSVIEGPILPGPSLIEWAAGVRAGTIEIPAIDGAGENGAGEIDAVLAAEIAGLTGASFPTRRLQSLYLAWFHEEAAAALGPNVTVESRRATAIRVDDIDDAAGQIVVLSTGVTLNVDLVLYSLGHNGADPSPEHTALTEFARRHDRYYLPPAFTADADTSALEPGERVIVRGFGLAAVDLTVLLTEGRGGRFTRLPDGRLHYAPSGLEPRVLIGSRRGVPYHSKISSTIVGEPPVPRFFTPDVAAALDRDSSTLDFTSDVWPLIAQEMVWGYYRELFTGHPERVSTSWADFSDRFDAIDPRALPVAAARPERSGERAASHPLTEWGADTFLIEQDAARFRALVESTVTDPIDRLFLPDFDRPLDGLRFESVAELQDALRDYIRRDLTLRTAPEHSATFALFIALLRSLFALSDIIDSPKWSAQSRVRDIHGWWLGYFSFIASGPPGHRLEELLALSEAGIVEFLGGDLWVETDEVTGLFRAGSANLDRVVTATALVDARLPDTVVSASDNPLLRSLLDSGAGVEEQATDAGFTGSTGRLAVRQADTRVLRPDGDHHPRRFAIGPYTNSPFVGAFSRPRTNAISFRENDKVARALLVHLDSLVGDPGRTRLPADLAASTR
ncbi:FAD/NAD(P)-binding protein [Cryobacterium sp. MDB1-18-2]|uniref:FAD/NAD(P)-binding protein n=1 Tax=unclassified Cryobacterium TaxID=2649013 RepID=UPI001069A81D|nr:MULTISPECIES: FAD/NAD(P)-binding protein [unclassified Cryobacterium]TFC25812.1 FAD/NAD(P)-binding protein [Cryobacterium sp. MDB1-18-2]TFC45643.1 FAD/NAD(P)-binding protein [Cryobacterium sp. MDB1-18-1]